MGALVVRFVSVKTPIEITAGGSTFKLQAVLDQFMPNLLPLLLVLLCWWLLNRRVNSLTIVIGIIVVALVGAFPWFGKFGFF
jgi:PTS system mannose-specific IID component